MAKKASPTQAIHTTAPRESCLILLNVITDRQIAELEEWTWGLAQYVTALRREKVPTHALREALAGRITNEEDARIVLMTARMLGPDNTDTLNGIIEQKWKAAAVKQRKLYSLPPIKP